jgi:hypothetical protein
MIVCTRISLSTLPIFTLSNPRGASLKDYGRNLVDCSYLKSSCVARLAMAQAAWKQMRLCGYVISHTT